MNVLENINNEYSVASMQDFILIFASLICFSLLLELSSSV